MTGDNVPASCISTRFAKIKKDFKGGKFASGSGTDTPTKAPRSATKAKQSNDKGRKKQNGEDNE